MSIKENITVGKPTEVNPGEWSCDVTWSGPSCKGSQRIAKHRSTHYEAKADAELLARRIAAQEKTAVTKGDMPTLPPPNISKTIEDMEDRPSGITMATGVMVDGKRVMMRASDTMSSLEADRDRKEEELQAAAKENKEAFGDPTFMDQRRAELLANKDEEIASLKEQVNKEAAEANHYSALVGQLREKVNKQEEELKASREIVKKYDMPSLDYLEFGLPSVGSTIMFVGASDSVGPFPAKWTTHKVTGYADGMISAGEYSFHINEVALDNAAEHIRALVDEDLDELDRIRKILAARGILSVSVANAFEAFVGVSDGALRKLDEKISALTYDYATFVESLCRCMNVEVEGTAKEMLSACLAKHTGLQAVLSRAEELHTHQLRRVEAMRDSWKASASESMGRHRDTAMALALSRASAAAYRVTSD